MPRPFAESSSPLLKPMALGHCTQLTSSRRLLRRTSYGVVPSHCQTNLGPRSKLKTHSI